MKYDDFLKNKRFVLESSGFDIDRSELNPMLYNFQKDIVRWALKKGKACIFADCGLGKTPMQLSWAYQVHRHTGGSVLYVVMYVSALAVSSLADLFKHKDNPNYNAVGASGAVSAVLFASVFFEPTMGIYFYFIPIPIPGFIFAPLYLIYCQWMARRNMDNIGHTAHFWGAVYGFIFPLIIKPSLFYHFINSFNV